MDFDIKRFHALQQQIQDLTDDLYIKNKLIKKLKIDYNELILHYENYIKSDLFRG